MRGRLIFPFLAELFRLDTRSQAMADPQGPGPFEGAMDPDFKEPVLVDPDDDGIGERIRHELPAIRIPCQIETKSFEEQRLFPSGNSPRSRLDLVFHFIELERRLLVDEVSGDALIRPGDRLGGIYDRANNLVQTIRMPPGLFVTEARPIGFGLHRRHPRRNLLLVTFQSRQLATGRTN
ncbi:MAG: hypothetical protein MJE77_17005 [Proteobacteria bacterium]|nr:hypothetical protein [Pseudomonadota bacterium]